MNRVFFFLFLLLTYYVAGSYRSVPLMIACIAEVVLSVLMFVASWYLKKGMQIRFGKKYDTVRTGQTYRCNLHAENQSRIPSRFKVSFQIYSPFSSEKVFFQSSADCNQEDESFLYIRFPYCGLYTVEMRKIWIYDLIQLFRRRKKCKEVMKVAALPSDPAADGECDFHQSVTEHENLFVSLGGNSNLAEIWQIRDYATGDSMRHIHWNQSARMETLLVREYETEEGKSCFLFLTNRRKIEVSEEGMDAFYRALWALAKRVLSAADTLEVLWNCTEPQEARRTAVSEESELAEMMRLLYESGKEPFLRCTDRQMQEMSMAPQFYLDYDLTLYDEEGIEWEWREKNCNQWSKSGKNEGRPYVRTGRFCRRRLRDSFPSSVRPRTFLSCSANRLGCSGFLYFPLVDSLFFCQSRLLV